MYDVVVIGAGPGGYACAIRAAQLGAKTCIIEKNGMGGTCTQRGCIPTKYLHSFGDIMRRANIAKKYGINASIQLDYNLLKSKMLSTVSKLATGIEILLKSNYVDIIAGDAQIVSQNEIVVSARSIETKNIVIATGGYFAGLGGYQFKDNLLSTTSVLELESLPESIIVVGGGYSGCEFAAILNAYGCKVTIVEAQKTLLPGLPNEVGNTIEKYMRIDGIDVITDSTVDRISHTGAIINGKEIKASKLLICIGRKPNIDEAELNKVGVKFNQHGIIVNEKLRTNVNNIYAIGDVTGMYELAHVASKQGEVAAENIMGMGSSMDYSAIPACVFTYPEVAFVGQLSGEKIGVFPLASSAKASCLGETRGFVRVYEQGGIIVGTLIIAPHAGELIGEAALAVRMKMKIEDLQDTIHAHPTLLESFLEAVRDVNNISIHTIKAAKSNTTSRT
ncbi:MAG TPA: dihydrolipoyl dehydrogenase [Candidatus Nitrosopolaris sp.]|nr:dihydrolipoyl dehydrogenase [Candidatus Nitrosopolaris sp.]